MPVVDSLVERDFFNDPFSLEEITELFKNVVIKDYISVRSPAFKKLNVDLHLLHDKEILNMMLEDPRLIRRPLILIDNKLIIGTDKSAMSNII